MQPATRSTLPLAAGTPEPARPAAGTRADPAGPLAAQRLADAGFVVTTAVVPDGVGPVRAALVAALESNARLVLTTGGTGGGPRDATPEGTAGLLTQQLPGVAEALRRSGAEHTAAAVLSRGLAGIADGPHGRAFVVNLPGSRAAVDQGLDVLLPLVEHVLAQLDGSDH